MQELLDDFGHIEDSFGGDPRRECIECALLPFGRPPHIRGAPIVDRVEQRTFSLWPSHTPVALDVFKQPQSIIVLEHETPTSRLDRDVTHRAEHTLVDLADDGQDEVVFGLSGTVADSGFDVSEFVAGLYDVEGVFFLPAAVEIPLAAFVEAQQARALHNLEIGVDNQGRTFLVGIAGSEGDQVVLVSVSLAEDE